MLLRRLGFKAGCAAIALLATSQAGRLQAASGDDVVVSKTVVQASAINVAFIESMIDDAMQDGAISQEERVLIVNQARRRLNASEVASIEARLATLTSAPRFRDDTKQEAPAATAAAPLAVDGNCCCDEAGCGGLCDNLYIFGAFDGWAGPIDDDNGNNFGVRVGFNAGMPLCESRGIGGQFGMSYGAYNFHGRSEPAVFEPSSVEDQIFITFGAFKRCNFCCDCPDRCSWGIVYDHLITDNLGEHSWEVGIGQIRGQFGYACDCYNEVGIMGSLHTNDKNKWTSDGDVPVSALDQFSLYWKHHHCWGADTTWYAGWAEEPGSIVLGNRTEVPLSQTCALIATAQYIIPSTGPGDRGSDDIFAEEFWNVSVGFAYYPRCNAASKSVCGRRWMPLMPVADNGTFAIDIAPNQF